MRGVFLLIVLIGGVLLYVYSGRYNVAASVPHTKPVEWMLNEVKNKSVEFHASEIRTPPLDDPSLVEKGFALYDDMCSGCHGSPGTEPAAGFNPSPPALAKTAGQMVPRETFWVVKHGIKMTGMPEFGSTHTDDEMWAIAAFVEKLPGMTEESYDLMKERADGHMHENGH